jgi:hypothetical protein
MKNCQQITVPVRTGIPLFKLGAHAAECLEGTNVGFVAVALLQ